jgi:hypothetical protein
MYNFRPITFAIVVAALAPHVIQAAQCPDTQYESGYKKNKPTVAAPEMINIVGPIFQGGKVVCHVSFDLMSGSNNVLHRVESGTLNGAKYRFDYTYGSGSVQGLPTNVLDILKDNYDENWDLRCMQDGMSDTHYCAMSRTGLIVGVFGASSYFVQIGNDHFPGSSIALRIDNAAPVTAPADPGFSPQQEAALVSAMKGGTSVLTRYVEWPHESNKDRSISLFGFGTALQIITTLNQTIQ